MGGGDTESQSGLEDGASGGPGAPTPLSALEVCRTFPFQPLIVTESDLTGIVAKTVL